MLETCRAGGRTEDARVTVVPADAKPRWIHDGSGDWSRVVPLPEDVSFLADLVRHADVNINVASTMTLDFAVRDKPVVNVAFDVADPPPFGVPLWEHYYRFEHYRPVVELVASCCWI